MSTRLSRFLGPLLIVLATLAMLSVSFEAEARRFGGGFSFGRQSSNILKQRQAVKPPAAANRASSQSRAANRSANTAGSRSGMSRWLGPLVGIAAGLGIASLLSALGLSGAFLELISSMVLIGLLVFGIMFIVRRLKPNGNRPAMQGNQTIHRRASTMPDWQQPDTTATPNTGVPHQTAASQPVDSTWFIPDDFDIPAFLANAKAQFKQIQTLWDNGDLDNLRELLTDDLLAEISPEIEAQTGNTKTDILLLNAELMGIEAVAGGHLASIRYSGMIKESANTEAQRFEEVWNLYKTDHSGWLLAGIQQL